MNKLQIIFLSLAVVTKCYAVDSPKEVTFTQGGDSVVVSIYKLNKPVRIKPLYEPRDDLETYPWMEALLFRLNGYALHIPKDDWSKYCEGEWSKEHYDQLETGLKQSKSRSVENPEKYGNNGRYYEIRIAVSCNVDGDRYLVFPFTEREKSGSASGGSFWLLKLYNGKWVNPYGGDVVKKMEQFNQCTGDAMSLARKHKLAILPISELSVMPSEVSDSSPFLGKWTADNYPEKDKSMTASIANDGTCTFSLHSADKTPIKSINGTWKATSATSIKFITEGKPSMRGKLSNKQTMLVTDPKDKVIEFVCDN